MIPMIRAWLRRWLGIDDGAVWIRMEAADAKIADLTRQVEALKYMRAQREEKTQNRSIMDWERVQAEYASNPENFKEN